METVAGVLSVYGRDVTEAGLSLWWAACSRFTLPQVLQALRAHVADAQRGRFAPLPADVVAQINGLNAGDGRPDPEEAWAMSLRAADENETVVWTTEMAQAWQACKSVFDLGDKIGARMAYREAYARLVQQARDAQMSTQWMASLGWDERRRADVLREAVDAGRLRQSDYLALPASMTSVPLLAAPDNTPEPGGIPAHIREQLRALRERLTAPVERGPSRDELAKAETERRKAQADERVREYMERAGAVESDRLGTTAELPQGIPA
ncbi:MAG: hypothetical protein LBH10_06775 [Burkholderiaceae bacterium]|nr:hypothetical protein [Burkholderiaceae bacterium]